MSQSKYNMFLEAAASGDIHTLGQILTDGQDINAVQEVPGRLKRNLVYPKMDDDGFDDAACPVCGTSLAGDYCKHVVYRLDDFGEEILVDWLQSLLNEDRAEDGDLELTEIITKPSCVVFESSFDMTENETAELGMGSGYRATYIIDWIPNAANPRVGLTALHVAVKHQQIEAAKWLLSQGADPNAPTKEMNTPLHFADRGSSESASILIAAGAVIDARNIDGELAWPVSL